MLMWKIFEKTSVVLMKMMRFRVDVVSTVLRKRDGETVC